MTNDFQSTYVEGKAGLMKRIVKSAKKCAKVILGRDFFYRTQHTCPVERHGSNYGGWVICPVLISDKSVVYSFGIGDDITFDTSIIAKYGMNVNAFDPTPKSLEWLNSQKLPEGFKFHCLGLADYDGQAIFHPTKPGAMNHFLRKRVMEGENGYAVNVNKLSTIMAKLGHNEIDILKMDIEGSEYGVLKDLIQCKLKVSQILLEFHHFVYNIPVKNTKNAINLLNKDGYKIFHLSDNGREFSFIKV